MINIAIFGDLLELDGYEYKRIFYKETKIMCYMIYVNEKNDNDYIIATYNKITEVFERKVILLDEFKSVDNLFLNKLAEYYSIALEFITNKIPVSDNTKDTLKAYETTDLIKDFILFNMSEVL